MIDIQVQVGSWGKPFILIDPEDPEEVGRVGGGG